MWHTSLRVAGAIVAIATTPLSGVSGCSVDASMASICYGVFVVVLASFFYGVCVPGFYAICDSRLNSLL